MFLYSFVSVSPILKLPCQHPADNPLVVVILYTQTLFVGVIILLPLFTVIAAVTSALPACLYGKLSGTVTFMLPALKSSHLTRNELLPFESPVSACCTYFSSINEKSTASAMLNLVRYLILCFRPSRILRCNL